MFAQQPRTEPRGSSLRKQAQYDTPTSKHQPTDLEFRGSFIKKSEEKRRLSRASADDHTKVRGFETHSAIEPKPAPPVHHHQPHHHSEKAPQAEPICVLKIELDDEIVEHIKIFPNEDPEVIVNQFGDKFDLS